MEFRAVTLAVMDATVFGRDKSSAAEMDHHFGRGFWGKEQRGREKERGRQGWREGERD